MGRKLADSTLIMIDLQNTYTRGVMELETCSPPSTRPPSSSTARAVQEPRSSTSCTTGVRGTPYDVHDDIRHIVDRVAPRAGEPVVVEDLPERVHGHGPRRTAHAPVEPCPGRVHDPHVRQLDRAGAFSLGHHPAVVASTTATRALPGTDGSIVSAAALQAASLAAVADLFGIVVAKPADIPV